MPTWGDGCREDHLESPMAPLAFGQRHGSISNGSEAISFAIAKAPRTARHRKSARLLPVLGLARRLFNAQAKHSRSDISRRHSST